MIFFPRKYEYPFSTEGFLKGQHLRKAANWQGNDPKEEVPVKRGGVLPITVGYALLLKYFPSTEEK